MFDFPAKDEVVKTVGEARDTIREVRDVIHNVNNVVLEVHRLIKAFEKAAAETAKHG